MATVEVPRSIYHHIMLEIVESCNNAAQSVIGHDALNPGAADQGLNQAWYFRTLEANGTRLIDVFPPYAFDRLAILEAAVDFHAELASTIPRIKFLLKNKKPGYPPPTLSAAMSQQLSHHRFNSVEQIKSTERSAFETLSGLDVLTISNESTALRMSQLLNDNLSQTHREAQIRFRPAAADYLNRIVERLDQLSTRLDFEFEMRPLLAMPNNDHDRIDALGPLRGINDVGLFLSASNLRMLDELSLLPTLTRRILFGDGYEGVDPQLVKLEYREWMDSCCMARLSFSDGVALELAPATLPPHLLSRIDRTVPFYFTPMFNVCSISDMVVGVGHIKPELDQQDARNISQLIHHAWMGGNHVDLLATCTCLIPALVSLYLAPVAVGRGHRKPSWIQSPMNAPFIRHVNLLAQMVLRELDEILE